MSSIRRQRRLVGLGCLGIALLMVVIGEFFPEKMDPYLQLTYWFVCFVFTGAAMLTAVADLLAVRQHSREERRALLETTIREIEETQRQEGFED